MKIFLARIRLLGAVAVAVPALLVAGCAASVSGEPAPQPGGPPSQLAPTTPGTRPQTPPRAGCQVTATSTGSISSSGAGGRTSTVNGRTSFSCGSGPMIGIEAIDGSGVSFSADGAVMRVASSSDGAVGAYRISVSRVEGGTAEFQVEPAG